MRESLKVESAVQRYAARGIRARDGGIQDLPAGDSAGRIDANPANQNPFPRRAFDVLDHLPRPEKGAELEVLAPKPTAASAAVGQRKKRILIYCMNYSPEMIGVGRYSGEFGAYMDGEGVDVDVITTPPHYPGWQVREGYRNRYSAERQANQRVTRCPLLLRSDMGGIWRLLAPLTFAVTSAPVAFWRILVDRPDTVLCIEPTLFNAPLALLLAKLTGARTVLHVQDLEVDAAFAVGHLRGSAWFEFAKKLESGILRSFDAVVTISNRIREKLEAKNVASERLGVVRNWVHLDQVKPLDRPSTYRAKLGLPDDAFVALYSGNIGLKQSLHLVLEAAKALVSERRLYFVIAGEGPEKAKLVKLFGTLPNVIFLPFQPEDDLCEFLNLADVHLLPQDACAADLVLPSKLAAMMASGKSILVMADPGTELFEFLGGGACIVRPGEVDDVVNCLLQLMRDGDKTNDQMNAMRVQAFDAKLNLPALRDLVIGTTQESSQVEGQPKPATFL